MEGIQGLTINKTPAACPWISLFGIHESYFRQKILVAEQWCCSECYKNQEEYATPLLVWNVCKQWQELPISHWFRLLGILHNNILIYFLPSYWLQMGKCLYLYSFELSLSPICIALLGSVLYLQRFFSV